MKASVALILTALLVACGGSSTSLSVRAGSPSAPKVARSALDLQNGIVLSHVRIVVTKVEMELAKTADAGLADLEEHEMKAGPFLIDLSGPTLDSGTPATIASSDIPAGTYKEIKFKIHKPQTTEPGVSADAGLTAMANANASIIADGTIDGATFSYSTQLDVEQELEGNFVLDGGNVTLNIDTSTWFGGAGAARLDPRNAGNNSQIENNIKNSFKAYRDDNKDGHED